MQFTVTSLPALAVGAGETVNSTSSKTVQPKAVFTVKRKVAGDVVTVIPLVTFVGEEIVAAPEVTLHAVLVTASPGLGVAAPVTEKLLPHLD